MRAVVIEQPGQVRVTDIADPTPGPGQVVVEVAACGICGTDLHIIDGEFAPTPYPIVPGHEFAGTVVAAGADVIELAVDDRVAVDPSLFCGDCHYCRQGRGNLCERWGAVGVTTSGGCADYVAVPAANAHRLPSDVPLEHAALIEPLSCAVHGFDRIDTRLGDRYLVYGAGTMGLLLVQLAHRAGASEVAVVDPNVDRLPVATQLGASAVAAGADDLERPRDYEVVIDATGVVAAIEDGLGRVRKGGTFMQFGVAPAEATAAWSPFRIYNEEITIVGSMAVLASYERAALLFAQGAIDAATMITDSLPLSSYDDAVARFRAGLGRKIQVRPGG